MVYEEEILIELKKITALLSGMYSRKEQSEDIVAITEQNAKAEIQLQNDRLIE